MSPLYPKLYLHMHYWLVVHQMYISEQQYHSDVISSSSLTSLSYFPTYLSYDKQDSINQSQFDGSFTESILNTWGSEVTLGFRFEWESRDRQMVGKEVGILLGSWGILYELWRIFGFKRKK